MKDRTRVSVLLSLLLVVFTSEVTAQVTECQNATLADVVFLVDSSSSTSDFQEVRSFLRNVVKGLEIGPNRVHVGLHGRGPEQGFLLKDHTDRKSLLAAVEKIPYRGGSATDVERSKAMDFLLTEHFAEKAGSRLNQRVPQIAVVITDSDSVESMVAPAQRLRSHGVLVFAIVVGGANRRELETITNWSPEHFLSIESYQDLLGLTDHLLSTLCTTIEAQRQALAERFADIFFLVDSGIAKGQLSLFKNDLIKLINQLGVSQSTYRVGLAQYGPTTQVEFNLNTHQTKQQTQAAVRGFRLDPQPNKPRNLGAALQYASTHFFTREAGGRAQESTPQHLVVVSGRKSSDSVSRAAQMVRSAGVNVYGMRAGATQDDIDLLASTQYTFDSPRVLLLKDFFLTEKKENITQECIAANVADVVFIVDESGSIGKDDFQLVRTFLHSVVSSLDVSPSKVRVGIVTYSSTPRAQAYLDTFSTKDEILRFINILPYRRGGTSTGAALNFTLENIFTEERGCRKNKDVQQVAVVITDGQSDDDVRDAATVLRRQARVTIYAVGIGKIVKDELEIMASHPPERHVFTVDSFIKLKPLKQNLQKILCENIRTNAITTTTRKTDNKEACVQKDEADIYFLMDDSGSIGNLDFQDMKDFMINFLNTFRIGPQHVRVGLVKYADDPKPEFDLTVHSDAKALKKAVEGIQHEGGGTNTGKALEFMGQFFDRPMVSRGHKVPEYLIVITDGESADDVKVPAEKLRAQGVIVYAIGVKESVDAQLKDIAGDPKRAVFVHSFDFLKTINNDIITDICTEDVCSDVQGDVFFLTDSSEGMSEKDFQTMKNFMKSVIRKISVGQNKVHVGVMQFSNTHQLEFPLNQHYSADIIAKAIDGMKQIKEGTFTGRALKEVSQYFDQARGGRPDVRQRLILITDNESKDQVKDPAKALRAKGVEIYAIGVVNADTTQLLDISGSSDRMYSGRDFDALKDLESQIALEICKKDCIIDKADIIFLVDSSPSIDLTRYESMQRFIESVVNHTTVGMDQTRFGLISSSDQLLSHFTLKDHDTKRKVLAAIQTAKPPQGDTSIAKALESSLQFFKAEHGGRKALKVPQILIVITDREATNPYDLKTPSDTLRNNGVVVVSIGVDKADKEQLKVMASEDTKRVFKVDTFEALESLYHTMSSALCIKPVCERADLVFLLDQSSSINQDQYKIVKDFTIELVNSFNISQEAVHVGVARFSDNPLDEFYLNQYFQKEQCVSHIRGMKYTGGNTNIGKALHRIKDYFTVGLGSRREIPKNLVLISDGDSHDDVEDDADFLRNQGIEVFAIGVGDVHDLQLLQITGTPERIFTAKNFHDLPYLRQRVVNTMCDDPNPPTPPPTLPPWPVVSRNCSIDIAMGFDISRRSGAPGERLVSGHPKLEKFLPEITRYVSSVQGLCCVGPDPVQTNIAFRVVGRDGRSRDDFGFEPYSEAVMDKVKALTVTEPSYFNTALLKSFGQKFKDESNADVKVLLIFSDGLDEDFMKLKEESKLLRQSGVSALLTVALEVVRDPYQLQMVEFGRGFDYKLPLSIGMQSVSSTILKQINTVSDKECCNITCKCFGHEGVHGPPGNPGTKGLPGLNGQPGFPGEEGASGERGPHGPGGPQGTQGCPGPRGQKGGRGLSGNRGDDGEDGLEGINGEQGVTGKDGDRGARGVPGNPGIPGIRGGEGPKGQRGLRGDPGEPGADDTRPGPKGDPGNPGPPGPHGADGDNGDAGDLGEPGPDGRRGPPGEKGKPGEAGDPGPRGAPGAPGPQGPRGKTGDPGPKGVPGFPGPQGEPGPAGDPGPVGRRGAHGLKGQPGNPGAKGSPGSPGPRGMPGMDGRDGYGPVGPPGVKGDPGFPGYPGLQGEDGDQGLKGLPGPKGNRGRGGNSGGPGGPGDPGDIGRKGHEGPRGPPGAPDLTECQLISYIRQNCDCCQGGSACPAFPTELVLGLDMSEDVTPAAFERQRSAVLSLLEDITVSESNCPTGARVAVVGYSNHTKYLIRFQDYRRKAQLIESVKNIVLEKTSNRRQLGAAMRFVGRNVFKRIRAGAMMRKVAVFLSNGPSEDVDDIITAVMEYRGLNIVPVVISLKNAPALGRAMEVDDSGRSIFTVLGRDMAADLKKIQNCAICYDPCERSEQCTFIQEPLRPQEVDVDLVLVADSSREMQADEYTGVQQLLGSVVEQLAVSPQPRRAGKQARVAVVQQSGTRATKVEFGLGAYQTSSLMRRHLIHNMTQQGGSSALGRALDFTLKEVLLKAGQPRTRRVLLTVVGSQTSYEDRAKLRYISQKAKCEGVAMFVVTVGDRYDRKQVEELASPPVQQHLIHLGRLKADEQDYGQRFFRVFLSTLSKGTNMYPPPALKWSCDQLTDPDDAQIFDVLDGQGSAEQGDEFVEVERTGGQTPYGQLELVNTLTKGHKQNFLSGPNINNPIVPIKQSSSAIEDICLLRPDAGGCSNYTVMWFYDNNHRKCSRFWYSSCGGNGNRFKTLRDCEELCVTKSQSGGAAGGAGGAGRPAGAAGGGGGRPAGAAGGGAGRPAGAAGGGAGRPAGAAGGGAGRPAGAAGGGAGRPAGAAGEGGVVTGRRHRLKKNVAVLNVDEEKLLEASRGSKSRPKHIEDV